MANDRKRKNKNMKKPFGVDANEPDSGKHEKQQKNILHWLDKCHRYSMLLVVGFIGLTLSLTAWMLSGAVFAFEVEAAPVAGKEDEQVCIGVLAKRGVERCQEKWGPTADYLTEQIPGYSFELRPLGFDEINATIEKGEVDFILANSSIYVEMEHLYGASRLATLNNLGMGEKYTVYGGVIFCRADRMDLRHLTDLKGKTFMAVKETSFGGWLVAWRELKEHGIDPHEDFASLSFGGTHDAVVYAVRDGRVDVGTVRTITLERMVLEGKIRLGDFFVFSHDHSHKFACEFPFVHSTDTYPEWPFAKAGHTSDKLARRVSVALFEMSSDNPAAIAARCVGWTIPLNYQLVHDCLKELRVSPYEDYGKVTADDVVREFWLWIAGVIVVLSIVIMILAYVHKLNRRFSETLTMAQDEIIKRKHTERALKESQRYTRKLIETSPDSLVMISTEEKITDVNRATEDITGYSREKLIGTDFSDYFTDPKKATQGCQQAFREEHVFNYSLEIKHRDGKITPVLYNASVYFNTKGEVTGLFATARDITRQILTEEMLRKTSQVLQNIMDSATEEIIVATDQTGTIVNWNEGSRRLLGYEPEEVVNKESIRIFHTEEYLNSGIMDRNFKRMITIEEPLEEELTYVAKGGKTFPVHQIITPRFDKDGKFAGILGMARDITERKKEESERQGLELEMNQNKKLEAVGSLASGIAHEINTPIQFVGDNTNFLSDSFESLLSLIEMYDSLWQEANAGGDLASLDSKRIKATEDIDLEYLREEIPSAVEQTLEGVQRVTKIVRAMKDFAHSDQGTKSPSNINDMLESTLTVARNELKYVADVETDFCQELPEIECYRDDLNQVFLNLLVNAAHTIADVVGDASAGKGTITVSTLRDNDNAIIRISDTGKGISRSIQDRVFDPFFSTKDVGKGSGQGLAIARKIVLEKHQGSLDFETEEGKGTTFIITLPITTREVVEVS